VSGLLDRARDRLAEPRYALGAAVAAGATVASGVGPALVAGSAAVGAVRTAQWAGRAVRDAANGDPDAGTVEGPELTHTPGEVAAGAALLGGGATVLAGGPVAGATVFGATLGAYDWGPRVRETLGPTVRAAAGPPLAAGARRIADGLAGPPRDDGEAAGPSGADDRDEGEAPDGRAGDEGDRSVLGGAVEAPETDDRGRDAGREGR
jgi:hypothetical protein